MRTRKTAPVEALAYNGLVQSWPELMRLAQEAGKGPVERQEELL